MRCLLSRKMGRDAYACWVNFQILCLCTLNNHTVRRRLAGAQSGLRPEPRLKIYRLGVYPRQAPPPAGPVAVKASQTLPSAGSGGAWASASSTFSRPDD